MGKGVGNGVLGVFVVVKEVLGVFVAGKEVLGGFEVGKEGKSKQ